jgi:hypothetical protein
MIGNNVIRNKFSRVCHGREYWGRAGWFNRHFSGVCSYLRHYSSLVNSSFSFCRSDFAAEHYLKQSGVFAFCKTVQRVSRIVFAD